MRARGLTAALTRIVPLVVLAVVAFACDDKADGGSGTVASKPDAGDAGDAGEGTDESTLTCDTPLSDYSSNLKPATPVDYLELRNESESSELPPFYGKSGSPCAAASDPPLCQSALDHVRLRDGRGWDVPPDGKGYLVFTRGDEVGVIDSTEDLVPFLGTIDTAEEARLLLSIRVRPLTCQTTPFETGWIRGDDGSWEFTLDDGAAGMTRVSVSASGDVTTLDTEE